MICFRGENTWIIALAGFQKKPSVVGVAAALSITLLGAGLNSAQAARWNFGDVDVSFDSTFSVGSSWRTENRNWNDNVAKANNLNNGFDFSHYNAALNANPKKTLRYGREQVVIPLTVIMVI